MYKACSIHTSAKLKQAGVIPTEWFGPTPLKYTRFGPTPLKYTRFGPTPLKYTILFQVESSPSPSAHTVGTSYSGLYEDDKIKHIKCYERLNLLKCTDEAAQTPLTYVVG